MTNAHENADKRDTLRHCWWPHKQVQNVLIWMSLKNLEINLRYGSAIALLGICPIIKTNHRKTCTPMFIAPLPTNWGMENEDMIYRQWNSFLSWRWNYIILSKMGTTGDSYSKQIMSSQKDKSSCFLSLMGLILNKYIKCSMWNGMHIEAKLFGNKGEWWERGGVRKVRVGRDGGINSTSIAYQSDINLYNSKMNY